jgi:hypothetical protein
MKRLLVFLTMTLLLTSCGGGGGNSVSIFETPTLTAYYVDAPVKGLIYEASPSGLNGVTDEQGAFNFKQGDFVSFYIDPVNRIYIGKVRPENGQVVIPAIANTFDSEVASPLVYLILYALDKAQLGTSFMDLSDLVLNSSMAEKVRLLLAKKEMPNQTADIWQSLASLQLEAPAYSFRASGGGMNDSGLRQHVFNSANQISNADIKPNDFSGVYAFHYGFTNIFLRFIPDGLVYVIEDNGTIASGTYSINSQDLKFQWDIKSNNSCDNILNLKQSGSQWSVITIREAETPMGCTSSPFIEVWSIAKIDTSISLSYVSGKILRIPASGLCAIGDGEVVFNISASGPAVDQRNVTAISSLCTNNQLISGIVKESGVPGVLLFEFNDANPRRKFFFSILQESGRAATSYSAEKIVPRVDFDYVYGAETTFKLE